MTRHRSSETGRYVTQGEAALDPAGTVSEALPEPVDLEAAAQRLYAALVVNPVAWEDLDQRIRDHYRRGAKAALEE